MSHSNLSAAVLNGFLFHFLRSYKKQGKYKKNKYENIRQPYKLQWYSSFFAQTWILWSSVVLLCRAFRAENLTFYSLTLGLSPGWPSGELQLWVVVTSLNTCSPRLLCLVSWPILGRVLVAPNVFHCVQTDERIWEIHLYFKFLPRTAAYQMCIGFKWKQPHSSNADWKVLCRERMNLSKHHCNNKLTFMWSGDKFTVQARSESH